MKKIITGALLLLTTSSISLAQTVTSNFQWAFSPTGNSNANTLTSPNFLFCGSDSVNFSVTSSSALICHASNRPGAPSPTTYTTPGILIPNDPINVFSNTLPITLNFSKTVCNLRIRFVDIDDDESLKNISTPYSNLVDVLGDIVPDLPSTGVTASVDNSTGWVEWTGSLNSISFDYYRPSNGYGIFIDSIMFDCCTVPCKCDHEATLKNASNPNSSGFSNATVTLNSNGIAVRSICINLPFYKSTADLPCLKCNTEEQAKYGSILSASAIGGVLPTLDDPYGLGYSRTICWNFPSPTVVNEQVLLDLQFPETLELSCCKNSVSYCLNVNFKNEDCTSCEYQLCTLFPEKEKAGKDSDKASVDLQTNTTWNDVAGQMAFTLSPNPTSGNVTITLTDESFLNGQLSILNAEGKDVYHGKVSKMEETIKLTDLTPGVYFVVIKSSEKTSSERLVIK
jgi:hypothetical protein